MIKYGVGMLRVSSLKQGLIGDSPEVQKSYILAKAQSMGVTIKKWFKFMESASGEYQPYQEVVDYCKTPKNQIKYFFIKSIDRATRGGAIPYQKLKDQLYDLDVALIDCFGVINPQKINTLAPWGLEYKWSIIRPSEKNEIMAAEDAKSMARDTVQRLIGAEVNYTNLGYRIHGAPMGYRSIKTDTPHGRRYILIPDEVEASWFIKMFEMRSDPTISDAAIVKVVNSLGYQSRKRAIRDSKDKTRVLRYTGFRKLKEKQLQKYISNPIYCGIVKEKWTLDKPIKGQFKGLVSVDLFNAANRGKITIIENSDGTVSIIKGTARKLLKKKDNPLYPYKRYVLCPFCRLPFLGSASRGKSGKTYPAYHCARCHKLFRIPVNEFHECINNFIADIKFSDVFKAKLREVTLKEWETVRDDVCKESISRERYVLQLKNEKQSILDKIKLLSHPTALAAMQDELDKVETKLTEAMDSRNTKEYEEISLETAISYVYYYIEHFKELLLQQTDPFKSAALFGLIFEERPTYADLQNRTPKLACLFELNQQSIQSKSTLVSAQRIEL